jgi:hypothetical protein
LRPARLAHEPTGRDDEQQSCMESAPLIRAHDQRLERANAGKEAQA